MRKYLMYGTMLLFATPALADISIENKLSGTGFNVVFDSVDQAKELAIGHFNDAGKHTNLVDFTNLGNTIFNGAANGNDIKITNTNDLKIQVFDATGTKVVGTTEDVFSLKGTGIVTLFVSAVDKFGVAEPLKTFTLAGHNKDGSIDTSSQSGFTLLAKNGEAITSFTLFDKDGMINDFEHYRINIAGPFAAPPVPEISTWAMMGIGFAFIGLLGLRRNAHSFRLI